MASMSIRFSAQAIRRKSRYKDSKILRYNSNEPMRLSISIDSRALGATAHRIIGEYEIPDDKVVEIEHRVWLEKGIHLSRALGQWTRMGPSSVSCARFCLSITRMRSIPCVTHLRCTWVQGPELHIHTLEHSGSFL